ncbi:MAG: IPExxxVDY family protein [Flammeovirgaceae bacterium]|nr:IPExxxVDY family protein [Flammeovirgaceae bacterium]
MKKKKLTIDYSYDFELIGITSAAKGYKLAWEINQLLGVRLLRKDDLIIHHKAKLKCHYTYFSSERAASQLKLFKNKPNDSKNLKACLVSEYSHYDFILMTQGEDHWPNPALQEQLRKIPSVEMIAFIPLDALKERITLFFNGTNHI